jgi:hypothetical protein
MAAVRLDVPSVAKVVTNSLRVRSRPEISAASQKLTPLLDAPLKIAVLAGPVSRSGYDWYLIKPLRGDTWFRPSGVSWGWVAAASRQGEPWIRQVPYDCPPKPMTLARLEALDGFIGWLCFGGESVTVRAQIVEGACMIDGAPELRPGWFFPSAEVAFNPPGTTPEESDPCQMLPVLHPDARLPDGGLRSLVGSTVQVTGVFDHPAARSCKLRLFDTEKWIGPPEGAIGCRETFVITRVRR